MTDFNGNVNVVTDKNNGGRINSLTTSEPATDGKPSSGIQFTRTADNLFTETSFIVGTDGKKIQGQTRTVDEETALKGMIRAAGNRKSLTVDGKELDSKELDKLVVKTAEIFDQKFPVKGGREDPNPKPLKEKLEEEIQVKNVFAMNAAVQEFIKGDSKPNSVSVPTYSAEKFNERSSNTKSV